MKFITLFLVLCASVIGFAQQSGTLKGTIVDENDIPVDLATIVADGVPAAISNEKGEFVLKLEADKIITLYVRHVSFQDYQRQISVKPNEVLSIRFKVNAGKYLTDVVFTEEKDRDLPMVSFDPKNFENIVTPGDPLTALLKNISLGIASNNELSSGYNVRGGNYDENLTYVNDVEVYRPFLARSGQQEGLSFINPDLIQNISFSSGGFEARYGDKMSSVLDINYRRPTSFAATVMASLLGVNLHIENAHFKKRLKYVMGFRYKSNNYILSGLDTKGDYQPTFIDYQAFVTYDVSEKVELNFMGTYSDNNYLVIPQNRTTQFGHVQEAKQLNVYFDGQEITRFQVGSGAFIFNYKPNSNHLHKLIASAYNTQESERFDIRGEYFLGEIEADLGDPNFGEVTNTVGVGGFLNHARNQLNASVYTVETKSKITRQPKNSESRNMMSFLWGLRYQHEQISDKLNEWNIADSSGYLLPYTGPFDINTIELQDVRKTNINLSSNRFQGYFQSAFTWYADSTKIVLNAGARAQYWDLNQEFIWSPRVQLAIQPNWKRDVVFRLCGGVYYQAPFYRELRNLEGNVNTNVKAQRSIHAVLAFDYNFKIWDRPFKFVTEVYYKHLDNLNPYEIDNVRIRYYGANNARGYATGIDMKLNGEFIKGLDSWVTMSVMRTEEDIENDSYVDNNGNTVTPGFIPRPTDQRFSLGIFFQDHLPKLPNFRVHLSLMFGSQLPFGPPNDNRYSDTLRAPFYRRVDIGFSYVIIPPNKKWEKRPKSVFRHFKTMWVSFEVFNLLDINNTISYLWIRDISGRQYAVPNYLTPRLFNLKLFMKF